MLDNSLVISLVRAHIQSGEEYMSYVPSYTKVRWSLTDTATEHVGSHWRRKAHAKRSIDVLMCVCKQLDLAPERPHSWPPVGRKRNRARKTRD
jgi:hypothetical protein